MSKSGRLRLADWREIGRLVGECCELGCDREAWREHMLARMADLVDAEIGMTGEMAGCRALRPESLGVTTWGWQTGFVARDVFDGHVEALVDDPSYSPVMLKGLGSLATGPAACFSRTDVEPDASWYASVDYRAIQRSYGADHILWCFQAIPAAISDESVGFIIMRAQGRRDFGGRERALAREVVAAVAPLVGGPLARYSDPRAADLPPRAREVLRRLLEGDGEKQIAARLGIGMNTVGQYRKMIHLHYGVHSRAELMSRWIRRGWSVPPPDRPEGR